MAIGGGGNRVHVAVTGDSSGLTKALKKADTEVDKFGKSVEKTATTSAKKADAAFEGFGKSVSTTFKKHAAMIKTGFALAAGRAIVGFVKTAVRANSDLTESVNAVGKVFGTASNVILGFGRIAADTVGLSNAEFNQLAANIGATLGNAGLSAEQLGTETIKLTKRAADLASVFNTDVDQALAAVTSGLNGMAVPLRKFGINIVQAEVRQRAVALGLADTTTTVDKQAKALATLDIFYEQSTTSAGDFADTIEDLANAQRVLEARVEDTAAAIGEALVPSVGFAQRAFLFMLEDLNGLIGRFSESTDSANRLRAAFKHMGEATPEDAALRLSSALRYLNDSQDAANKTSEEHNKTYAENNKTAASSAKQNLVTAETFEQLAGASGLTAEELHDASVQALNMVRASDATAAAVGKMEDAFERQVRALKLTDKATTDLLAKYGIAAGAAQAYGRAQSILRGESEQLETAIVDVDEAFDGVANQYDTARARAARYRMGLELLTQAERDQADATDEATAASERREDSLRSIHNPLFRAVEVIDELAHANKHVARAERKFGTDSRQFEAAVIERANIIASFQDTLLLLQEEGIEPTGEAARSMLEGMQIPDHVIDGIFADLDRIKAAIGQRFADWPLSSDRGGGGGGGAGGPNPHHSRFAEPFHTGGRVNAPRGQETTIRALGGEIVTNPAHQGAPTGPATGAGNVTTYNVTVQVGAVFGVRADEIALMVEQELVKLRGEGFVTNE